MRDPFKLIVWGPGGLGAICIREALRLPEFELAGVRTYGPAKVGIDAGTLVGLDPAGVLLYAQKPASYSRDREYRYVLMCKVGTKENPFLTLKVEPCDDICSLVIP